MQRETSPSYVIRSRSSDCNPFDHGFAACRMQDRRPQFALTVAHMSIHIIDSQLRSSRISNSHGGMDWVFVVRLPLPWNKMALLNSPRTFRHAVLSQVSVRTMAASLPMYLGRCVIESTMNIPSYSILGQVSVRTMAASLPMYLDRCVIEYTMSIPSYSILGQVSV